MCVALVKNKICISPLCVRSSRGFLFPFFSSFPIFFHPFLFHESHLCTVHWRILLPFFSRFPIFFHLFYFMNSPSVYLVKWKVLLPFFCAFVFLPFILLHEFPLCVCGPEEDSNLFLIKLVNSLPFIFPS